MFLERNILTPFLVNLHYITKYSYEELYLNETIRIPIATRKQAEFHKAWFRYAYIASGYSKLVLRHKYKPHTKARRMLKDKSYREFMTPEMFR